jgi:hypothetical protein
MRALPLFALVALACAGGDDTDVTTVADCDAAETYPDTVAWRAVRVPDDCARFEPQVPVDPPTVLTTAEGFEALFECPAGTPTGVDFASERLAIAVFPVNPDATLLDAHRDGDRIRLRAGQRYELQPRHPCCRHRRRLLVESVSRKPGNGGR